MRLSAITQRDLHLRRTQSPYYAEATRPYQGIPAQPAQPARRTRTGVQAARPPQPPRPPAKPVPPTPPEPPQPPQPQQGGPKYLQPKPEIGVKPPKRKNKKA